VTSTPPLGLLLDVDGPISSTRTRTVRLNGLAADLVAIARSGCPVVFNTGRSVDFLAEQVLPALTQAGLTASDPVWGVGEKGGTWFSLVERDGVPAIGEVSLDETIAPPAALVQAGKRIAAEHSDVVFFDNTKRTMVSLEQHVAVPREEFLPRRDEIVEAFERAIQETGAKGFTIYPTVISVDVEHVDSGKALGASRALELIAPRMHAPRRWFTAGDSGQDYDMATYLHEHGFEVSHLDVRLSGDVPDTPFDVIREVPVLEDGSAEDDITARHISRLRLEIGA
jgi:hydroxymethylpyrimidine pyrophosphatase-like HAD family hydrolase